MNKDLKQELFQVFKESIQPPFSGGFYRWAEQNIELPSAYAIPGRLDLSISPYLLAPMQAIDDPRIVQVNLCMATQVGKSLVSELFVPYIIINAPGPLLRIFHNQDVSDIFTSTRLVPLLKNCRVIKPLLKYDRFSTGKKGITMPHMSVICGSSNTALQHGLSIKYLLADELHQWEPGQFNKFMARTTAFSGRRKIICASQPSKTGHEWEQLSYKGLIYEWNWHCPACNTIQPFYWSKERADGSFCGFNWDSILDSTGNTNITLSSATTYLECEKCRHHINDTPIERRQLNDNGTYICTKLDGDPNIVTYMCPCWVNPNLSFASKAAEYMIAKRTKRTTGLDELMEIFVEQSLGKFYKKEAEADLSRILIEAYDKEVKDKNWYLTMGVDVQRIGGVKYYVVRAWNKNGTESKRLAFGIARTFDEIEEIRKKHNVLLPMLHIDSGDGTMTAEIYQECIKHGQVVKINGILQYVSWTATKGDQKVSYKHLDNIMRLHSPPSPQSAGFPEGHKLAGIPVGLILFSNFSLKTILGNLRDNLILDVKWKIDAPDQEYDAQLYAESLVDVVDKKSGLMTKRWMQHRDNNHYFDCEVLNLLGSIRANVFSSIKINEDDIRKMIAAVEKPKDPTLLTSIR